MEAVLGNMDIDTDYIACEATKALAIGKYINIDFIRPYYRSIGYVDVVVLVSVALEK